MESIHFDVERHTIMWNWPGKVRRQRTFANQRRNRHCFCRLIRRSRQDSLTQARAAAVERCRRAREEVAEVRRGGRDGQFLRHSTAKQSWLVAVFEAEQRLGAVLRQLGEERRQGLELARKPGDAWHNQHQA